MGDFQAIDIGLGLMFIYLVLSFVCTGLNEFIAGIFKRRRRNLLKGLKFILTQTENSNLVENFKNHPLIKSLYGNDFQASYIPPHIFSTVLLDLLGMLQKVASSVLAILPCSRTESTLRA